ncbi:MAG: translation initiation factor IF-5A [Desulfurococcaceae archaeon]
MSKTYKTLGDLKVGDYLVLDNEPCRIVEYSKAKTGKHGSAKAHIVAMGLFSGAKKTIVAPVDQQVEVPIIEKRVGTIIADLGDKVQIMDTETYETFEVEKELVNEKVREKLAQGVDVEYWNVMGRRMVVRLR